MAETLIERAEEAKYTGGNIITMRLIGKRPDSKVLVVTHLETSDGYSFGSKRSRSGYPVLTNGQGAHILMPHPVRGDLHVGPYRIYLR